MSFLEPLLLAGLPLAALPVVIHLLNQRRYQTLAWGAMQFLLEASRTSRGYARIRQWLILAARTLAVLGLVLAASRPLASGRLGLRIGGGADAAYVVVDRSPSMQQRGTQTATDKLARGLEQIAAALEATGVRNCLLVDSVGRRPTPLDGPAALRLASQAGPASASADLPRLMQEVLEHIRVNRVGQAEVWICSDLRANDWQADSGLWPQLRAEFAALPQEVRFHLLAYPQEADANLALRATEIRRSDGSAGSQLLLSLTVARTADGPPQRVPVQIEIDGARSEAVVELSGRQAALENYPLPLAGGRQQGWGRLALPADANPADNEFYFVYGEPPVQRTVVVAEQRAATRPLQLAASIAADETRASEVDVRAPEQLAGVAWDETALVLWQAPLPTSTTPLAEFVARGGQLVLLPPAAPDGRELWGVRWTAWQTSGEPARVADWRNDADLLARTRSGAALPVDELQIARHCGLAGSVVPLATLAGGAPLLARAAEAPGGVYFLATTLDDRDASLARDGVVWYAAIQRALSAGCERLGVASLRIAGVGDAHGAEGWVRVAGPSDRLSSEAAFQAGAYRADARWIAVNRSPAEDLAAVVPQPRIDALFAGLRYDRADDQTDASRRLAREIWRTLLAAMLAALVVEAALCLPKPAAAAARGRGEFA
jgi:hypothetical protein